MLNMLIAIMGDTFDEVTEKRAIYVMDSKLQTMSEYAGVIDLFNSYFGKESESYLFVVKQVRGDDEDDGMDESNIWEGGFKNLRFSMKNGF